jgi:hypothetical protein
MTSGVLKSRQPCVQVNQMGGSGVIRFCMYCSRICTSPPRLGLRLPWQGMCRPGANKKAVPQLRHGLLCKTSGFGRRSDDRGCNAAWRLLRPGASSCSLRTRDRCRRSPGEVEAADVGTVLHFRRARSEDIGTVRNLCLEPPGARQTLWRSRHLRHLDRSGLKQIRHNLFHQLPGTRRRFCAGQSQVCI